MACEAELYSEFNKMKKRGEGTWDTWFQDLSIPKHAVFILDRLAVFVDKT